MDSPSLLYIFKVLFMTNLRFRVGFERKSVLPARYGIYLGRYGWALGALKTGAACVTLTFGRV